MKTKNKRNYLKQSGITLIALVVTIVVLLILAGVSLNAIFGQDGIIQKAKDSENKMNQATQNDLDSINELDKLISSLTNKTTDGEVPNELERYFLGEDKKGKVISEMVKEGEEDIVFIGNDIIPDAETSIKYKDMAEGTDEQSINIKIEYKNEHYIVEVDAETVKTKTIKKVAKMTVAMFDTGKNVRTKIDSIIPEGVIKDGDTSFNLSVDTIEKYNSIPDLTKMTESNIVSLEQSKFPVYMWFEKSGKTEIRSMIGQTNLTEENEITKKVEIGKMYWWSESDSVYLNPDSSNMFEYFPYLANIDGLKCMKTDYVVDMSEMFISLGTQLSNIDALSIWNTSKVENMSYMFYRYALEKSLSNVNALSNWDTSKVTNMSGMFAGNKELTDIEGLKNWNVSNVTNINKMFGCIDSSGCGFTSLSAISNWNVRNVNDMSSMFDNCKKLEDASAISNWNITTIATKMFSECYNLKNITIPGTVIKIYSEAFNGCSNLTQVKILATDANEFEVGSSAFSNIASDSKIYVLSEEIKAKLEGNYDTSKTTVEVVTLDEMNNL